MYKKNSSYLFLMDAFCPKYDQSMPYFVSFSSDSRNPGKTLTRCTSEFKLLISLSYIFEQAARQSQITPDSYHEKHRDHPDDGKSYGLG